VPIKVSQNQRRAHVTLRVLLIAAARRFTSCLLDGLVLTHSTQHPAPKRPTLALISYRRANFYALHGGSFPDVSPSAYFPGSSAWSWDSMLAPLYVQ
jgi:hypothetical protein